MSCLKATHFYLSTLRKIVAPQNAVYKCKIASEKTVDVSEQLNKLAGKTENPEKYCSARSLA